MNQLEKDLADHNLPKNFDNFDKAPEELEAGQQIGWWFKDDEEYHKECYGDDKSWPLKDHPPFQGVVIPGEGLENRGHDTYESQDMVIVQTLYPCEKCYPEVAWFALKRLVDNKNLVKIIKIKEARRN